MNQNSEYFDIYEGYSSLGTSEQNHTTEGYVVDFRIEACAPVNPSLHHAFFNINLIDSYWLQRDDTLLDELFERAGNINNSSSTSQDSDGSETDMEL